MGEFYPRQAFMIFVIAGGPFIAAILVGLRVYGRYRAKINLSWDDYLIILANLFSILLIAPSVINVKMWHYGIHIWDVNQRQLEPDFGDYHKVLLAYNVLHTLVLPTVKASIMILLLRIGSVVNYVRRSVYVVFVFNALCCIGPLIALLFMCPPRTGGTAADSVFNGLKCLEPRQSGIVFVVIVTTNLFTDLLIFPIPLFMIARLQHAELRLKFFAILSFALSLGVTALGAYRLYVMWSFMLYNSWGSSSDWTWDIKWCLNHAENNLAIMFACVPTLRALIVSWKSGDRRQQELRKAGPGMSGTVSLESGQKESTAEKGGLELVIVPSQANSLEPSRERSTAILSPRKTLFTYLHSAPCPSNTARNLRGESSADDINVLFRDL